jgi:hypothetical protein
MNAHKKKSAYCRQQQLRTFAPITPSWTAATGDQPAGARGILLLLLLGACQTGANIKISASPYSEYCSQEISQQSLYHLDPQDYTAVSIEQFKRCKSTLGLVQTLFHS